MGHISGGNRYQTKIMCLDEYVAKDSIVRAIDHFVDALDLDGLGFKNVVPNALGRNSYSPPSPFCPFCPASSALCGQRPFRNLIGKPRLPSSTG
jgi:hypothetical protein